VHQLVEKRAVPFAVTYEVPIGAVELPIDDVQTVELLLSTFPLH